MIVCVGVCICLVHHLSKPGISKNIFIVPSFMKPNCILQKSPSGLCVEKKKKKERKNSSFLGDSGAVAQDSSVMMDVDTLGSKFSFNCSQQCF